MKSGYKGLPNIERLLPHLSVKYENHNLGGHGTQLSAKMEAADLINQDDLHFEVVLSRPYFFGTDDPKKTTLDIAAFSRRNQSPVFISSAEVDANPIFVDRIGVKAS